MKHLLFNLAIYCLALSAFSQNSFSTGFNSQQSQIIYPRQKYLEIRFDWNLEGRLQAFLNSGITELQNGNLVKAKIDLEESLKLSPTWMGYYYRGVFHRMTENAGAAEFDFREVIRMNPKCYEAYVEIGNLMLLKGDIEVASQNFERSIKVNSNQAFGYFGLGHCNLQSNPGKAKDYFIKATQVDSKFSEGYLMLGLIGFKNNVIGEHTIKYLNEAVSADSTYSAALLWRGLAYAVLKQYEKSLADLNRLIVLNPTNGLFLFLRGNIQIELQNFNKAFIDLRKALMLNIEDEDFFVAGQTLLDKKIDLQFAANYLYRYGFGLKDESFDYLKKGFCHLVLGNYHEAVENCTKSLQVEKSSPAFLLIAIAYEHSGKHTMALNHYSSALAVDNDIFDAHKKRGVYRYELQDWKGAYEDFNEMIRLQPDLIISYRLRGLVKGHEKDCDGAILDLTKVVDAQVADVEVWRTRGACYLEIGDTLKANQDFEKCVALDSRKEYLYEMIINNYLSIKDTTNAIRVIKNYAKAFSDHYTPQFLLIHVYVMQRDWVNAMAELEKCKQPKVTFNGIGVLSERHNSLVLYYDALIDFHRGENESAIKKLTKAIKSDPENLDALFLRAKAYLKERNIKLASMDKRKLLQKGYAEANSLVID
jgi:tetratricopeptide (TPR) repeat protein